MTKAEPPVTLDVLRAEIDRIDRELHARLIERGEIIDELIAVKAKQQGSSAFRPAREADMMRELVSRHRGILPLATVEGIWRIIISTFTYVQAPYAVHADAAGGDARMRDSARFHFGFTVPLVTHAGAADVVAAVSKAEGDLGLVRLDATGGSWWRALRDPDAPKVIARLPFVERIDHAAGLPLFIVAKPLRDGASRDVLLYAVEAPSTDALAADIEIVARDAESFVVAVPGASDADAIAASLSRDGQPAPSVTFIGSHAARFEVGS